jgi:hypothetical protein
MIAHAAEQHPLLGATREQVLSRYGEPRSTLAAGSRELLFYARERVVLREGVVVEVERLTTEPVRRPPATPPPQSVPAAASTPETSVPAPQAPSSASPAAPAERTAGSAPVQDTPATEATPSPAQPPEPKLEIKRVLPPGATGPRPLANTQSTPPVLEKKTASTAGASPSTPRPADLAPSQAQENAGVPAAAGSVVSERSPLPASTNPPASETPAVASAPVSASSQPAPVTAPAEANAPAVTAEPGATPAAGVAVEITEEAKTDNAITAAAKKAAEKRAAEARAARRRLEAAEADAESATAAAFSRSTYVIAAIVMITGVGYLIWRRRQRQLELAATTVSHSPFEPVAAATSTGVKFSPDLLSKLEWRRFEELVASYYSKTGVVATRTKAGPAAPVNIKISWKGETRPFALVHCIAQPVGLVGAAPIQALHDRLLAEDIRRGYVVTTGKFSVPARDFAEEKHITLLPGDIFLEKLNALPEAPRSDLYQQTTAGDYTTPSCPQCEAKMLKAPDDPTVWRCVNHPDQQLPVRIG